MSGPAVSGDTRSVLIARMRAERLPDPADQRKFLDVFGMVRAAALHGKDSYPLYAAALATDDSVTVAAIIEAEASTRQRPVYW